MLCWILFLFVSLPVIKHWLCISGVGRKRAPCLRVFWTKWIYIIVFSWQCPCCISPSTMMNNFIVTQLDFLTTSTETFHSSHLCINDATTTRLPFSLRHSHRVSTPEARRGNSNFIWNGERHWNTHYVINANFSKLVATLIMDIFLQLPFPHIIINENYTH